MFEGAITGQFEFDSTEIFETELPSAGIVAVKVAPPGRENVCKADTEASIVAAADPVVAVTNPWNVAGPPASAVRGIAPRLVPPGRRLLPLRYRPLLLR